MPPTPGSRSCSTRARGATTPTRCATRAPPCPDLWSRCTCPRPRSGSSSGTTRSSPRSRGGPSRGSASTRICSECGRYHEWLVALQNAALDQEPDPLHRIPRVLLQAAVCYRRDPVARATTRLLEESNQLDLPHLTPVWVRWWMGTLREAQDRGQVSADIEIDRFAWILTAAWYGSQSNSHAESNWVRLPDRLADLLRFALLPAVTDPDAAGRLRADLERLPA